MTTDESALATVKELATAVSTQARVSNRVWLTLMTVALVALIPRPNAGTGLSLPFGFGAAEPKSFYLVLFAGLVVLTIAFAGAHAQQVRAQKLAQRAIDSLTEGSQQVMGIHPRDLFDMLREPSVNRVAALSQLLRGKYQFYGDNLQCPVWLRVLSTTYYFVLKSVSLVVYFGLPGFALWQTYEQTISTLGSRTAVNVVGLVAAVALTHVGVVDMLYLIEVSRKIWGAGGEPPNKRPHPTAAGPQLPPLPRLPRGRRG